MNVKRESGAKAMAIGHTISNPNADHINSKSKTSFGLGWAFWLSFIWVLAILFLTLSTFVIEWQSPLKQKYSLIAVAPSLENFLGTDHLGRDLFSRIIHGARVSFSVAFTSPFIGMGVGLILGMCAGYFGKWVDSAVGVLIDSILAFPNIVLAIAILFFAGANLPNMVAVIAFYTIPQFTRIARANTLLYTNREFVTAARAQGASHLHILLRELLPNVFIPVAAFSLLIMSFTIVLEGTLSFLGVGLPPPTPTWGRMIAEGIDELADNPQIAFLPSAFMFLTILSLNMMGDRLRQLTDIKSGNT